MKAAAKHRGDVFSLGINENLLIKNLFLEKETPKQPAEEESPNKPADVYAVV